MLHLIFLSMLLSTLLIGSTTKERISDAELERQVNAKLKSEGYQLPSEFRSYLPTCNYWPLEGE